MVAGGEAVAAGAGVQVRTGRRKPGTCVPSTTTQTIRVAISMASMTPMPAISRHHVSLCLTASLNSSTTASTTTGQVMCGSTGVTPVVPGAPLFPGETTKAETKKTGTMTVSDRSPCSGVTARSSRIPARDRGDVR